jgi:hypothetical protein
MTGDVCHNLYTHMGVIENVDAFLQLINESVR